MQAKAEVIVDPVVAAEVKSLQDKLDRVENDLRLKGMLLRTPVGRAAAMGLTEEAVNEARAQKNALEAEARALREQISALSR